MTKEEFFEQLKALPLEWELRLREPYSGEEFPDGEPSYLIRTKDSHLCPILALGVSGEDDSRGVDDLDNFLWTRYAKRLGLEESFALEVVVASDIYGANPVLRKKLLDALKLKEGD